MNQALPQRPLRLVFCRMLTESSPQSGEMFIATRFPLIISAKSEMPGISLFAEEGSRALFINITYLRHVRPDSPERYFGGKADEQRARIIFYLPVLKAPLIRSLMRRF